MRFVPVTGSRELRQLPPRLIRGGANEAGHDSSEGHRPLVDADRVPIEAGGDALDRSIEVALQGFIQVEIGARLSRLGAAKQPPDSRSVRQATGSSESLEPRDVDFEVPTLSGGIGNSLESTPIPQRIIRRSGRQVLTMLSDFRE
jgi:hypothetical protein